MALAGPTGLAFWVKLGSSGTALILGPHSSSCLKPCPYGNINFDRLSKTHLPSELGQLTHLQKWRTLGIGQSRLERMAHDIDDLEKRGLFPRCQIADVKQRPKF